MQQPTSPSKKTFISSIIGLFSFIKWSNITYSKEVADEGEKDALPLANSSKEFREENEDNSLSIYVDKIADEVGVNEAILIGISDDAMKQTPLNNTVADLIEVTGVARANTPAEVLPKPADSSLELLSIFKKSSDTIKHQVEPVQVQQKCPTHKKARCVSFSFPPAVDIDETRPSSLLPGQVRTPTIESPSPIPGGDWSSLTPPPM